MNATRRARQKLNRHLNGGHGQHDHLALGTHTFISAAGRHFEVRDPCTQCRPAPLTITQRAAMSAQREQAMLAAKRARAAMPAVPDFRDMIGQALAATRVRAGSIGRRTGYTTRGYRKVAK